MYSTVNFELNQYPRWPYEPAHVRFSVPEVSTFMRLFSCATIRPCHPEGFSDLNLVSSEAYHRSYTNIDTLSTAIVGRDRDVHGRPGRTGSLKKRTPWPGPARAPEHIESATFFHWSLLGFFTELNYWRFLLNVIIEETLKSRKFVTKCMKNWIWPPKALWKQYFPAQKNVGSERTKHRWPDLEKARLGPLARPRAGPYQHWVLLQ